MDLELSTRGDQGRRTSRARTRESKGIAVKRAVQAFDELPEQSVGDWRPRHAWLAAADVGADRVLRSDTLGERVLLSKLEREVLELELRRLQIPVAQIDDAVDLRRDVRQIRDGPDDRWFARF